MIEPKIKELYDKKAQQLISDINNIIESPLPKAEQSKRIMARLREECIFVKNSYIKTFINSSSVTIKPYSADVKPELEESDVEGSEDKEYCKIPAYSFGPFDRLTYFDDETFKFLWILKEPYCESHDELLCRYYIKDPEYYDQSKTQWEDLYPTHKNLIRVTREILQIVRPKHNGYTEQDAMKHICILEVNHFPGLAFKGIKSNDEVIGTWAEINTDLIKTQISFYHPNVIIGGNALGHFFTEGYRVVGAGNNHCFEHILKGIDEGKNLFAGLGLTNLKGEKYNLKVRNDYVFMTEEGVILIDSSHPSRYSKEQSKVNGMQVSSFLTN